MNAAPLAELALRRSSDLLLEAAFAAGAGRFDEARDVAYRAVIQAGQLDRIVAEHAPQQAELPFGGER
jgi:hypothetical protein